MCGVLWFDLYGNCDYFFLIAITIYRVLSCHVMIYDSKCTGCHVRSTSTLLVVFHLQIYMIMHD